MKDVLIILILIIIPRQVCISNHVVQLIFANYPLISLEKEEETIAFLRAYVKLLGSRVESPLRR